MSKLNKDILFLLFEELQDDTKSLFSCLFVNRLWCETMVPILWRNPWCFKKKINDKIKSSLYYVITFTLSNDIKLFLTSMGIYLPPISHKSLLFDYLYFCKSINVKVINKIISICSSSTYKRFHLQQEIYNNFMRKCPGLKYLDMRSLRHQIFYFTGAKICLGSLCEITCDMSINPTYYYGLASVCQSIQRLIIFNKDQKTNDGIVKLLEIQKNLKHFEWNDDLRDLNKINKIIFKKEVYEEIFKTLEKKANTLNFLVTNFQDYENCGTIIPINFSRFHNLKKLLIKFPYDKFEYQLRRGCYQELETLHLDCIQCSTICRVVLNNGGRLRKILVNDYDVLSNTFFQDSLILIRTIYKNCPLIEYLSLSFSKSTIHFVEFENLLKACQKLKGLLLVINEVMSKQLESVEEEKFESGEKLSRALTQSAPDNLTEIRFGEIFPYSGFKFSSKTLDTFFDNWRGRKALSMYACDLEYKKVEYAEIIKKYIDEGVVKEFIRGSLKDAIFDYEL